jgi:hypothetical protein
MPGATTNDRPSPNPGETGINGTSAACVIRELSDRSPEASGGANFAPADSPLPDNLWFIRLADWTPASRTQPRSGGGQPADGGTIFFEGADQFAEQFQSDPRLGLYSGEAEPFSEQRIILWMRAGDDALRAVTLNGDSSRNSTKIQPARIESSTGSDLQDSAELRQTALNTASPLLVWTLWTNPLCL